MLDKPHRKQQQSEQKPVVLEVDVVDDDQPRVEEH